MTTKTGDRHAAKNTTLLDRIKALFDDPGPFATAYVDVSRAQEDGDTRAELAARAAYDELVEQGAPDWVAEQVRARDCRGDVAGLPGLTLWHWPKSARGTESAKMHAKVAIADGRSMLVSSANLTQSGAHDSLEAGVLIRGGTAPQRALEYVHDLQARGVLARLPPFAI